MKLTFHTEDLTLETLKLIQRDMSKYAHLSMYKDTFLEINKAIKNREHIPVSQEEYRRASEEYKAKQEARVELERVKEEMQKSDQRFAEKMEKDNG